jgi:8-oxo-dGTP diphosphatase
MIKVVCGIIYKGDEIFISRRKAEKVLGGYWEFPGGKIEVGENDEDSLTRELFEELGMKVIVNELFKTVIYHYENFSIELIAYKCDFLEATFNLTDHDLFEWVNIEELKNWQLAPADIPIAEQLILNQIKTQ